MKKFLIFAWRRPREVTRTCICFCFFLSQMVTAKVHPIKLATSKVHSENGKLWVLKKKKKKKDNDNNNDPFNSY